MTTTRKQDSPKFKARVAIEAIRGEKTLNQLGSHFGVHPVQVAHWRRAALEQMEEIFVDGRRRKDRAKKEALYEQIGRLKVELDWLKKKLVCSAEDRRAWVEPEQARLSLRRQCELLGVNRASLYYQAVGERAENLRLMRRIDEQYTRCPPVDGSRRLIRQLTDCGARGLKSIASGWRG